MTAFVSFRCNSVSGWFTVPTPTLLPFNNTSPVPSGSSMMSPLEPSLSVIVPLYNKEVFIDFKSRNLNTPLTKAVQRKSEEGDHCLILESNRQVILEFYSSKELTSFIKFLLDPFSDHSILSIVQNLQVPTNDQLKLVISNFESMKNALELTYRESQLRISKIL